MRYYILSVVIIILLCVTAAWLLTRPDVKEQMTTVLAPPTASTDPIVFVSGATKEMAAVTFGTSTALLNGAGYNNLLLNQVEVVSGAKYEAPSENLTLWNQGDQLTIKRGRKLMFEGTNQAVYLPSDAAAANPLATTSTTALNLAGTYLWQETVKTGKSVVPNKPGLFAITFSDGKLTGTTDCNGFSGLYTKEGDTITVSSLAMAKMFCEDSQEMEFTQQFVGVLTASQSGTTLTLTHADGTINTFEAKQ